MAEQTYQKLKKFTLRQGGREAGREGGREGGREAGREGGREGRVSGDTSGNDCQNSSSILYCMDAHNIHASTFQYLFPVLINNSHNFVCIYIL